MGDNSGIEWTDATWNPTRGCSRISPGCTNCYAERQAARMDVPGGAYQGLLDHTKAGRPRWNGQVRLVESQLDLPIRWTKPRRIFVDSMSDLFHEGLPVEAIARVFAVMVRATKHTFQVLTKRAARMQKLLSDVEFWRLVQRKHDEQRGAPGCPSLAADLHAYPLKRIWLGVSVEDQQRADERIPLLLQTPAAVRFVSAEPLLGPVDIRRFLWPVHDQWPSPYRTPEEARAAGAVVTRHRQALVSAAREFVDWVIVGAESGSGARPMDETWVRSLRDQCRDAGSLFFFKQSLDGGGKKVSLPVLDGKRHAEFPA
jgi:protein gp37